MLSKQQRRKHALSNTLSKSQIKQMAQKGQLILNQQISVVSQEVSNDMKRLIDLFNIRDMKNLESSASQLAKGSAYVAALNTASGSNIDETIQTLYNTIEQAYINKPEPTDEAAKTALQQEFKLVQSMFSNKQKLYQREVLLQTNQAELLAMPQGTKDEQDKHAVKSSQVSQMQQKVFYQNQGYLLQLAEVYRRVNKAQDVATLLKMINNQIESQLPPKFCWRYQAAEKVCNSPDYSYQMFACREKCATGYERFGFHCRKACLEQELVEEKCKYTWFNTRISRKLPNGQWGSSELRTLSRASTTNQGKSINTDSGFTLSCPAQFTPQTGWFQDTCKPKNDYTCESIGYTAGRCAIFGCAISPTDCNNYKADALVNVATGVLKFATLFVAPGTGAILGWVQQGLGYLQGIKDLLKKVRDARTQFKNVFNSQKLRDNLVYKIQESLNGIEGFKEAFQLAVLQTKGADFQARLDATIRAVLVKQNKLILKSDTKNTNLGEGETLEPLNTTDKSDMAKDLIALAASATDNIYRGLNDEAVKAFFNNNDQLGQLFSFDGLFSFFTTAKSCIDTKTGSNAIVSSDCISAMVSSASTFDPTGVTNILKALIQPSCDVGVSLKQMGIDLVAEEVQVTGVLNKKGSGLFGGLTSHDRTFVLMKNQDVIRYYDGAAQVQNYKGEIWLGSIKQIDIAVKSGKTTTITLRKDKSEERNQIILNPKEDGTSDAWVAFFTKYKTDKRL